MTARSFLAVVVDALDASAIPFMVCGSVASSFHGTFRSTQDLDLVVEADAPALIRLVAALQEAGFYVDLDSALRALGREGQFNAIETSSGWKADFVVRKSRPFSREEFARRIDVDIEGTRLSVATAEDVVLTKLEWAARGGSERQIEDAVGILRSLGDRLDRSHIERWVRELGIEALWERALERANS